MTTVWSPLLSTLPLAPAPPVGRTVVISAHPDDEVLAIGGWLSGRRDADLVFVTVTDGEASHPDSQTTTPDDLRARRPGELVAALQSLGIEAPDVRRLQRPDGALGEDPRGLAADLAPLVDGAALVLAPFEHDGHPDHEAVGIAALQVGGGVPVWRFPIWTLAWTTPAQQAWLGAARRLPVTAADRERKERAIADFATQVQPLSEHPGDAAIVGGELLAHALIGPEVVVT